MIGLDTLAHLRRSGRRPTRVEVTTHIAAHPQLAANVMDWNAMTGDLVWSVVITPNEPLHRADLRALQSLPVEVDGTDGARVAEVAEACKSAGASRVIAGMRRYDRHGTCRLVWQTDTEGVFVYGELPA